MNTTGKAALAVLALGWCSATAVAQASKPFAPDFARLLDRKGATVFNRALTVATEGGRTVARLDARPADGGVLLEGVQISEGVIDVDLRGKDVAQQSFLGIAFHVVDWTTLDAVYFRPFNFRGADPERRSHSVQYVSHPANTWQKLRAERPGQFESALEPPPDPNGWFHVRMVLTSGKVEVYVNGAVKPSLAVDDLGTNKSGGVALFVGNGSDGAFATLTITPTAPAVADIAGYLTFLDDVLDVLPENATFASGHGRDLNAAGVGAYRDTLNTMVGIIRTNLAAGRTPEQMVQDDVLKEYQAQYSLLQFLLPNILIPRVVTAVQQGTLK